MMPAGREGVGCENSQVMILYIAVKRKNLLKKSELFPQIERKAKSCASLKRGKSDVVRWQKQIQQNANLRGVL